MATRVHNRIISITIRLLFILLIAFIITIFTLLIWAKQGISIDSLEVFDHKFSKVYIKWHKKLHIDIDTVAQLRSKPSKPKLPPLFLMLNIAKNTLHHLKISHYTTATDDIAITYQNDAINVKSKQIFFSANIDYLDSHIFIPDLTLSLEKEKLYLKGEVRLHEKHNHVEMLALAQLDQNRKADIFLEINKGIVNITAKSNSVRNLEFLNRFITISPNVKPWIFEKLQATTFRLDSFSSRFPFHKPEKFLPNLKAVATVTNVSYQFDPKLSPIKAPVASVEYFQNDLSITPTDATYQGYPLSQTKVMLNNLQGNPYLKLFFNTKELVNEAFLGILERYLQKVPLKQSRGKNSIDFYLVYDFKKNQTHIKTDIRVKDAHIDINDYPVEIYDAKVHLNDNDLTIDHAKFKSFQALKTSLSGKLNLKTLLGNLKVYVSQFDTALVKLLNDLSIHFKFDTDGIKISSSTAHWKLFNTMPFLSSKSSIFIDKNQTLHVQNMRFYKPAVFEANMEGELSLNNRSKKNSLAFNFKELTALIDENKTFHLDYPFSIKADADNAYHFQSSRTIQFSHGDKPISLESFSFDWGKKLGMKISDFRFKDIFQTNFSFDYDKSKKKGFIDLSGIHANLMLTKPQLFVLKDKNIHFTIDATEDIRIHESDYNMTYLNNGKIHQFTLHDLNTLYTLSPFFQKYAIKKGRMNLISRDLKNFNLFTTLNYFPIPGYINNDTNETIFITSTYGEAGFKTIINDAITLSIGDTLDFNIENTNLDLQPFLKPKADTSPSKEKMIPIAINAKNGFLQLGKQEKILYNNLNAHIDESIIKATLFHDKGEALLALEDSNIELYGEKFNDNFIRSLLNFKGLEGGSFNFFIKGNGEKLLGGIELKESTFKGFALYNNILSFLNAIPALVTFNNPGFNADGFKVKKGKVQFEKRQDIITIKSIDLKGNASNILGSGLVDLKKDHIDLTLRIFLLKEMGKILSSVPIAGYLLLGDDGSLTTTITIKGKLDKPDISIDLGTDILMAPVNIIKRTLLAPVRFFDWITGGDDKKSKDDF